MPPGNTYTVTAIGTGGYSQTLTATINVLSGGGKLYYHLESGEYTLLTVWNEGNTAGDVTITYTGNRLTEADKTKYGPLVFDTNGEPIYAGQYTASISKQNGETPVTVSADYTIAKADQTPPAKPTYTVPEGTANVVINKVATNGVTNTEAQYRLSYYSDNVLQSTEWQKIENGNTMVTITMGNAWISYYVEARYEELADYNPSEIVRADAVYHYAGNVTVKIICDEGIDPHFSPTVGSDDKFNGATLTLDTLEGYYVIGGQYNYKVTATLQKKDEPSPNNYPVNKVDNSDNQYSVTSVPDNSILTITIGTARKAPVVTGQVTPKQRFSPFTGAAATTISRDSAFTAAFQVKNFDPVYTGDDGTSYGAYTDLRLTFASAIPAGTTIILLDRRDSTYWYYRAGGGDSIPLTAFTRMGESGTFYSIPHPTAPTTPDTPNGYVDLSYQFIVDFSQSGGYTGDSLTMALEATAKDADTKAPEVKPTVTVTMADSGFTFAKASENGLTCKLDCTFNAGAAASKWENRASALVLTPNAGTTLPPDARIKAVVNGRTSYLYKSGDSFIIPMSLLQAEATASLTLQSSLFPENETSYPFTAEWKISPSKAGKAPLTGNQAGTTLNVTFVSAQKTVPSLKSTGEKRVLTSGDSLGLTITTKNMTGYTVSAALLRKLETGTYTGTGWNNQDVSDGHLSVPLGGQNPGSYCVMLTVKKTGKISIEMQVPYYFVIKPAQ